MTWRDELHPRDGEGQFTHSSVGAWAQHAAAQLSLAAKRRGEQRPPGHADAKARAEHLWSIPDRRAGVERTDAEQDELNRLEAAFSAYRKRLGLRQAEHQDGLTYADDLGQLYNEYGERLSGRDVSAPAALRRGYTRVADDSRIGHTERDAMHPQGGGLWIDPTRPGTRHAPRYLDDSGHLVAELQPDQARTARRKVSMQFMRSMGMFGSPEGLTDREVRSTQPRVRTAGRLGYGLAEAEAGAVFVAHMKRARPRARQETGREGVRRTPRGTPIEQWMERVSEQYEGRHAARGGR